MLFEKTLSDIFLLSLFSIVSCFWSSIIMYRKDFIPNYYSKGIQYMRLYKIMVHHFTYFFIKKTYCSNVHVNDNKIRI